MKNLVSLAVAIALCILILPPAHAQPEKKALQKEKQEGFKELLGYLHIKQRELEQKLLQQEEIKRQAEAGTRAKNPKVADENRQAVIIIKQAIAITQQAIRRTEAAIERIEKQREICMEIRNKMRRARTALLRLQNTIQAGNRDLEEWARQSEDAARSALNIAIDMLKSGTIGKMGAEIDKQIEMIKDPGGLEELRRVKAAIDRTKAKIDEMSNVSEFVSNPDLERSLNVLISILDDPGVQNLLKISGTLGALANSLQYGVDYFYHATRFGVSWKRINQLDKNSDEYLRAVRALHEQMKKSVKELEENNCKVISVE